MKRMQRNGLYITKQLVMQQLSREESPPRDKKDMNMVQGKKVWFTFIGLSSNEWPRDETCEGYQREMFISDQFRGQVHSLYRLSDELNGHTSIR